MSDSPPGGGLRLGRRRVIPEAALDERFVQSGGPGGQNVNKVATKVELRLRLADSGLSDADLARIREKLGARISADDVLVLHASEERSRERNRELARERLVALLLAALARPKKRRPSRPTRASRERRLAAKKRRSQLKSDRSQGSQGD